MEVKTSREKDKVKTLLLIMQSIIEEGKLQKEIVKETGYTKGHISIYIRSLQASKPALVNQDKDRLYYVPLEDLIREYCQDSGDFSEKEVEELIQTVNSKRSIIAQKNISKLKWRRPRDFIENSNLLFLELIKLGFEREEIKTDKLLYRFIEYITVVSFLDIGKNILIQKYISINNKDSVTELNKEIRTLKDFMLRFSKFKNSKEEENSL
jgi:hypothetical protein